MKQQEFSNAVHALMQAGAILRRAQDNHYSLQDIADTRCSAGEAESVWELRSVIGALSWLVQDLYFSPGVDEPTAADLEEPASHAPATSTVSDVETANVYKRYARVQFGTQHLG